MREFWAPEEEIPPQLVKKKVLCQAAQLCGHPSISVLLPELWIAGLCWSLQSSAGPHTRAHAHSPTVSFGIPKSPQIGVFVLWEEVGEPRENPQMHREHAPQHYTTTPYRKVQGPGIEPRTCEVAALTIVATSLKNFQKYVYAMQFKYVNYVFTSTDRKWASPWVFILS